MKISDVAEIQSGMTVKSRLIEDRLKGFSVIRLQDIGSSSVIDLNSLAKVHIPDVSPRYTVSRGDVVFRSRGTWNTAALVPAELDSITVAIMPVLILRPVQSLITPKFLTWEINKPGTQRYFRRVSHSSTIPMIRRSELEKLEIDLPDLETQELVAETAELVEKTHQLQTSLSVHKNRLAKYRLSLALK